MKKKIYQHPETLVMAIPYQPLLAGSPITKTSEEVEDFEDLLSRGIIPEDD